MEREKAGFGGRFGGEPEKVRVSSRRLPYSQVSTRPYNAVMYCSADSPSRWHRGLKRAISSITFRLTLKNPSNIAITSPLRDRIVVDIRDAGLSERLQLDPDLTFTAKLPIQSCHAL